MTLAEIRRPLTRGMLVVASLIAFVGCALEAESTPRRIADDPSLDSATDLGSTESDSGIGRVYLQRSDASGTSVLVGVQRDLTLDPNAALSILFDGPTADEQASGLRSAIPRDVALLSTRFIASGTLRVDVDSTIFDATGDDLVGAVAQIVFTLTDIDGIERVSLTVDGEAVQWPRGDGTSTSRALTEFDFPGRAMSSQPDYPSIIE